jgi:hypothetical protein
MYYSVAGRTVLIDAYDDWSANVVSHVFAGWFLTLLSRQPDPGADTTLRIHCGVTPPPIPSGLTTYSITNGGSCYTDDHIYYLKFDGSLVVFGPGPARVVDLWVDKPYELPSSTVVQLVSHALSPALRRSGVFEIHSAAVIPPDHQKAIMIAGPSGCGKSTLTSQLARCGWRYLSDDILLLKEVERTIEVWAFRRFFALTADTVAAVKLSRVNVKEVAGAKERVSPQEHFETDPVEHALPGTIIFPTVTREANSHLTRLTSTQTMTRLLRLCPWASYDKPTSLGHLRMLGSLAHSTSAFELLAGTNILDDPKLAAEVIYSVISES